MSLHVIPKVQPHIVWTIPHHADTDTDIDTCIETASFQHPCYVDTSMQLASVHPQCAGTFTYSPAHNTLLSVGTHTLYVTFTPSCSRSTCSCSGSVRVTVKKSLPLLSWATPAYMHFPTPLSTTQLCCGSNLRGGVFIYEPPLDTVLPVGKHKLRVTFMPDATSEDSDNFESASLGVSVVVLEACVRVPVLVWDINKERERERDKLRDDDLDADAAAKRSGGDNGDKQRERRRGVDVIDGVGVGVGDKEETVICYPKPLRLKEELCARCNESLGALVYSPPAGTVLEVGVHVLTVTFLPFRNNTAVTSASLSVSLTVRHATVHMQWTPLLSSLVYGSRIDATPGIGWWRRRRKNCMGCLGCTCIPLPCSLCWIPRCTSCTASSYLPIPATTCLVA